MTSTFFALMAEFNEAHVPIVKVGQKYFGYDEAKAKVKAARGEYPFPVFRAGSQKSTWLVSLVDLANYLDKARDAAARDMQHARADYV